MRKYYFHILFNIYIDFISNLNYLIFVCYVCMLCIFSWDYLAGNYYFLYINIFLHWHYLYFFFYFFLYREINWQNNYFIIIIIYIFLLYFIHFYLKIRMYLMYFEWDYLEGNHVYKNCFYLDFSKIIIIIFLISFFMFIWQAGCKNPQHDL